MYSNKEISKFFKYLSSILAVVTMVTLVSFGQGASIKKIGTDESSARQLPRMGIFSAAIPATSIPTAKSNTRNLKSAGMILPTETSPVVRGEQVNSQVDNYLAQVVDLMQNKTTMSESAAKLKISENEMKALYSRFMHKGKSGLMTHTRSNLGDFVNHFKGHWTLNSRVVGGQKTAVNADMYFNMSLDPTGTRVIGEVLVVETGRFDSKVCKLGPGEVDGEAFVIAAFMEAEGVIGADGSLDWTFEGEVQGSYGSYRNSVKTPRLKTNYYNFGEAYTAIAPVADDPLTKDKIEINDTDFDDVYVEGETMVMKSTGFDVIDTYHRIEPEARSVQGIWNLEDYFIMLKGSGVLSKPPTAWEIKKLENPKSKERKKSKN